MSRSRTFWQLLTLLLIPVSAMAIVSIVIYSLSVSNLRAAVIQEIDTRLTGVSEQNEATVREVLAVSEVIRRDPRVIDFYKNGIGGRVPESDEKDLQDLLLLYRSWNPKLASIALLGSRDEPVLASDGTFAHGQISHLFLQNGVPEGGASAVTRFIRLSSGLQLVFDDANGRIVLVRPTIIAGRPARIVFVMQPDFPEAGVSQALGHRNINIEIYAQSILDEKILIYGNSPTQGTTPSAQRRSQAATPNELIHDDSDFWYSITVPTQTINAEVRTPQAVLIIPLVVGLLFAIVLTMILSRRIYRPVTQLVKILTHNAPDESQFDTSFKEKPRDEHNLQGDDIAFVLRSFNELMGRLSRLRACINLFAPFAAEDIFSRALIGGEPEAVATLNNLPGWSWNDRRSVRFMVSLVSVSGPATGVQDPRSTDDLRKTLSAVMFSGRVFFIHIHPGVFALLFMETSGEGVPIDLQSIREAIDVVTGRHKQLKIVAGCSEYYRDLDDLQNAFVRARTAHAAAYYHGSVIGTEEMVRTHRPSLSVDDEVRFVNFASAGDEANALPLIAGLFINAGAEPGAVVQAASLLLRASKAVGTGEKRAQNLLVQAVSHASREADRAVIQSEVLRLADELIAAGKDAARGVDWPTLRKFMDAHFADDLHLEGIADTFGVSPRTLSQIISRSAHKTFPELLNSIRCAAARDLILKNAHTSLSSIAEQVGYRSERTFFRQFKMVMGIRPSEVRRQARTLA